VDITAGHAVTRAIAGPGLESAYRYCDDFTRRHARHFYYAFLFMSPGRRRAIHAVYAFCQRADQTVDEAAEPGIKRQRLDALRRDLDQLDRAEDPMLVALRDTLARFPIRTELLYHLLDGMEMDLGAADYATFAELERYCWRVASVVGLMSIEIFGYRDPRVRPFAETLGLAMQLTNVARDVAEDAAEGRIYLPADERARHGVSARDLVSRRFHPGVRALMEEFCGRADRLYDEAFALLPPGERAAMRPALIMAALYRRLLVEIRNRDYDVLQGKVRYPLWRKLAIALATARRWP
jgi:phytoene synthase